MENEILLTEHAPGKQEQTALTVDKSGHNQHLPQSIFCLENVENVAHAAHTFLRHPLLHKILSDKLRTKTKLSF